MLIFIVPALLSILTVTAATWVLRCLSVAWRPSLKHVCFLGLLPDQLTFLPVSSLAQEALIHVHSSLCNLQYLLVVNSFKKILIWKCCEARKDCLHPSFLKIKYASCSLVTFLFKFLYPRTQISFLLFFLTHTSRCF